MQFLTAALLAGFEPRILAITDLDPALEGYGFAPVGSVFLPSWGLRAHAEGASGWGASLHMSYGFALHRAEGNPVPTTTSQVLLGGGPGRALGKRGHLAVHTGFASLGHAVGSEVQGGALTYLGPYLEPRLALRLVDGPGVLEVSVAALAHVPVGRAHANTLWEEDFSRTVIGGASVALHGGFGVAP